MSLSSNVRVEWIAAVTIAAGTAAIGYLAYKKFYVKDHRNKNMVNLHIQKDDPKVVHAFDMEDLGDKAVYCRCWRSKKVNITIFLAKEEKEISLFSRKDFLKWILASAIPRKDVCSLNTEAEEVKKKKERKKETEEFPFCDGAHTKHNEETGDNVGPLIIKRKET